MKSIADIIAESKEDYYFVQGNVCPPEARKAYVDAVRRLQKEGKDQAVVYMPGHVGYVAVPWYPGLEKLIPELGGKFIGGLLCEPVND